METNQEKALVLTQLSGTELEEILKPKSYVKLDKLRVSKALEELEQARNETWNETFIDRCLQEFENINWDTYTCVERINNCKLKKQYGETKFAEFLEDDDLVVDNQLIELKAKMLLQRKNYVNVTTYHRLINYWDSLKKPTTDKGMEKPFYELKLKLHMKEIIDESYKNFLNELFAQGIVLDGKVEKASGDFISELKKHLETFTL